MTVMEFKHGWLIAHIHNRSLRKWRFPRGCDRTSPIHNRAHSTRRSRTPLNLGTRNSCFSRNSVQTDCGGTADIRALGLAPRVRTIRGKGAQKKKAMTLSSCSRQNPVIGLSLAHQKKKEISSIISKKNCRLSLTYGWRDCQDCNFTNNI
jgi:hypothetical protein